MTALALFPMGFTLAEAAGEIVVDHVFPLVRGTDNLALVAVGSNDLLFIEGWATTAGADRRAADAVYLNLDRVPAIAAALGEERADVASVHGPKTLHCGYRGVVPLGRVAPGFHTISASVLDFAQASYSTGPELRFLVVDPHVRAKPSDAVRLESAVDADSDVVDGDGTADLIYGTRIRIRGSVSKRPQAAQPASVIVIVDEAIVESTFGHARPDFADGNAITFEAVVGSELFGGGPHTIRAIALAADGTPIEESANTIQFNVLETLR